MLSHSIEGRIRNEAVVRHVAYDTLLADAVGREPDGFDVRVTELSQERGGGVRAVGVSYAGVHLAILSVLVVVVLSDLTGIVRWVCDDNPDGCLSLSPNPFRIGFVEHA